jgi:hypothetical protein
MKDDKEISLKIPNYSKDSRSSAKRGLSSDSKIVKNLKRDFISTRDQNRLEET